MVFKSYKIKHTKINFPGRYATLENRISVRAFGCIVNGLQSGHNRVSERLDIK